MAKVLVDESCFFGIADAIREKTSSTATYKPREMADAISKIQGGGETKFGLSVDNVIGDVSTDGTLSTPEPADIVLDGVTRLRAGDLYCCNYGKTFSAPDLTVMSDVNSMQRAFYQSLNLVSAEFPALEEVRAGNALYQAFSCTNSLKKLAFPSLRIINGEYALYKMCEITPQLASVDFSSLERVYGDYAGYYAFHFASSLEEVSFPSLLVVNGSNAFGEFFYYCGKLKSVSFPKLELIIGHNVFRYAFDVCRAMTFVEFPALATIDCTASALYSGGQFSDATYGSGITTMRFSKLKEVYANSDSRSDGPFASCSTLTRIDFPALTTIGTHYTGTGTVSDTAIKNMFYGCSSLKEIHFGAANQAAVEAMPGYDTLWGLGAGNATVYFDL